jgi:thioredoxin-like negative regulator of GroEL
MSIPSLLIFRNGQVVKTMVGAQSKDNFKREIDSVLS